MINKIYKHPFFNGLNPKAFLILTLGIIAFVFIALDLASERARENNEIGFFTASLNNLDDPGTEITCNASVISSAGHIPLLNNIIIVQGKVSEFHSQRAPPVL